MKTNLDYKEIIKKVICSWARRKRVNNDKLDLFVNKTQATYDLNSLLWSNSLLWTKTHMLMDI